MFIKNYISKLKLISTEFLWKNFPLYIVNNVATFCNVQTMSRELRYSCFPLTTYVCFYRLELWTSVSSINCNMFLLAEPDDKPETIKSAADLDGGRVFTDTFIHFLRFTSDKTTEPITSRVTKTHLRLNLNCEEVASFSLFLLNDIVVIKCKKRAIITFVKFVISFIFYKRFANVATIRKNALRMNLIISFRGSHSIISLRYVGSSSLSIIVFKGSYHPKELLPPSSYQTSLSGIARETLTTIFNIVLNRLFNQRLLSPLILSHYILLIRVC